MAEPRDGRTSRAGEHPPERLRALVSGYRNANLAFDLIGQTLQDEAALGRTDLRVLQILSESGPLGAGEIAERTGLTTGSVTALLNRLEAARCLERSTDAGDGRRRIVRITRLGRRRWERAFATLQEVLAEVAGEFDDVEMDVVLRFLTLAEEVCRDALEG
ncbi:MAG TPA: MarR family transcriptional regulator [Candidatus Dormibacteraeota bacterium]|nr:MarR family transcriptional regulator [Candidatus Dormibacteraeota bacterium]